MNKTNKPKTHRIGSTWYFLPFRSNGSWVEDAKGNNVAEAASIEIAKSLVSLLNLQADVANALK